MAMEYLEGEDLEKYINGLSRNKFFLKQDTRLTVQILRNLTASSWGDKCYSPNLPKYVLKYNRRMEVNISSKNTPVGRNVKKREEIEWATQKYNLLIK